jgi:hypothetical protein
LRAVLAADQAQYGGFATTRRAHERGDFAPRNLERNVVKDDPFAIPEGQVPEFNEGVRKTLHVGK